MCTKTIAFSIILASYSLVSEHIRGSSGLDLFNALRSKLVYLPVTVSLSSQRLSGNFYNSCAETQLKTREQHQEKTFKRPGWSAYWNSSRETALFPLSSCKLRSPFRVQWRSRSHSFSLSSCFSGHTEAWAGRQWSLKTPRITELMHCRHVHFRPHTCDHLSPARWSPGHLSSVSTPAGPAGYSVVPFSGWITGFSDRGRKIQKHRLIITVTNLNFSNSTAMTAAMWGSTSS